MENNNENNNDNNEYKGRSLPELRVEMYKVLRGRDKQSAIQLAEALGEFEGKEGWNFFDAEGLELLKKMPTKEEFDSIEEDKMLWLGDPANDLIGANDVVQRFRKSVDRFRADSYFIYSKPEYRDKMREVLDAIGQPGDMDLSMIIGAQALDTTALEDLEVPDPTKDRGSQQQQL